MKCKLEDLRRKEVIDITTGERLGYIDDAELDIDTSEVSALIIYGRPRLFGILGREDDVVIPCGDIKVVGSEVILISPRNKRTVNTLPSYSTKTDSAAL